MVKVEVDPYQRLTVRSYARYDDASSLLKAIAISHTPSVQDVGHKSGVMVVAGLFWAEGVIFRFFTLPATDSVVKEYLQGHLIWDHIDFAPMKEYEEYVRLHDPPVIAKVVNASNHSLFVEVAKWISSELLHQ